MNKINNWKDEAYKIDILREAEIIEDGTLKEVLSYAESIMSTYEFEGFMRDGLNDTNKNVRKNNRKEKRQLEKFIKKWDG